MSSTALLLAALSGSVEVVRLLIEEYGKSLDEVNNVSVYPTKHRTTVSCYNFEGMSQAARYVLGLLGTVHIMLDMIMA